MSSDTQQAPPTDATPAALAGPGYLVICYGESDAPAMTFATGRATLRAAIRDMIYWSGSSRLNAEEEGHIDAIMTDVDDLTQWSLDGHRFDIKFEIGGIEITKLAGNARPMEECHPGYEERRAIYEETRNSLMDEWLNARPKVTRSRELEAVWEGGFRMAWGEDLYTPGVDQR